MNFDIGTEVLEVMHDVNSRGTWLIDMLLHMERERKRERSLFCLTCGVVAHNGSKVEIKLYSSGPGGLCYAPTHGFSLSRGDDGKMHG